MYILACNVVVVCVWMGVVCDAGTSTEACLSASPICCTAGGRTKQEDYWWVVSEIERKSMYILACNVVVVRVWMGVVCHAGAAQRTV
jgi:hypothetical protein